MVADVDGREGPGGDETRSGAEWQLKATWIVGLLRVAPLPSCLVRKSFLSNAEPGLGGRGQEEYSPLGFLQSTCSVLMWLSEIEEGLGVGERSSF